MAARSDSMRLAQSGISCGSGNCFFGALALCTAFLRIHGSQSDYKIYK